MLVSATPAAADDVDGDADGVEEAPAFPSALLPVAAGSAALATVAVASVTVATINPDASLLFNRSIVMAVLVDMRAFS
jgi:hypothetical protein